MVSFKLSDAQKSAGRRLYQIFALSNGMSFAAAGDSTVILYALKIGIPPWVVALTSSFIFLTLPFMLLGKRLAARKGAVRTISHAWVWRSSFAFGLLLIPWLSEAFTITAGGLALAALVFGYWASRAMGTLAMYPVVGEITTKEERGRFNARIFASFYTTYLLTSLMIVAFFFLTEAPLWAFQILIFFGSAVGFIGSFIVSNIQETDIPRRSAAYPLRMHVSMIAHSPVIRHITVAWAVCSSAAALIGPFSILALKNAYMVADSRAVFYAIIQVFGGLLGSMSAGRIARRTGPRPLIIVCFCAMLLPTIMWIAAPSAFNPIYCLLLFFLVGACAAGSEISLSSYFLNAAPDSHRIGLTLVVLSISGTTAGIAGSVLGASLLKILMGAVDSQLMLYKYYFHRHRHPAGGWIHRHRQARSA